MLECNRLCIDPGDGSPALEYRLEDDRVEFRIIEAAAEKNATTDRPWKTVSSEELGSHVMSGTVLAKWLQHRMGFRRLLRACNPKFLAATETPERTHPRAA